VARPLARYLATVMVILLEITGGLCGT